MRVIEREAMFEVDDSVIYSNHGVCKVVKIGTLSMNQADAEKLYYTLSPVYQKDSVFYVPVENTAVVRPVLSADAVEQLIHDLPSIEACEIKDEKNRETVFKERILSSDPYQIASVLKTLWRRREKRKKISKPLAQLDERYLTQAQSQLFEEFAYVLRIAIDEVPDYIDGKLAENGG